MNYCILQKDPKRPGEYDTRALGKLVFEGIDKAIDLSLQGSNITVLRLELKKLLESIGDAYTNSQLDVLTRYVTEMFELAEVLDFVPNLGIKNTMSKKYRKNTDDSKTAEYYEGKDGIELSTSATSFINDVFGNLADIKRDLKSRVSHLLINSFIINRKEGKLVQSTNDINENVRNLKQELYSEILNHLIEKNPELEYIENLFEGEEYTGALDLILTKGNLTFNKYLNPSDIEKLYYNDSETYNKVVSWFTLRNFDHFVNLILGDFIYINPEHKGKLSSGNSYQYASKGNTNIISWRDSDDIYLEQEINKLSQALINSTPFYKFGSLVETNKFTNFDDFFRVITRIKDSVYNPETSNIIFNPSDLSFSNFLNNLSPKDKADLRLRSLRDVINSIQSNPLKYIRIIMQALNDPNLKLMEKLGFDEKEKDMCWSFYKGLFDPKHLESIKNIQSKYDYRSKQYYQHLTQTATSMYSVLFLQYYENEDGSVVLRDLKDLSSDNVRRSLELDILRRNSRRSRINFELTDLKPWNAQPTYNSTKQLLGIKFEIALENGRKLSVELNDLGTSEPVYRLDGIITQESFWEDLNVHKFIKSQLGFELLKDKDFKSAIELQFTNPFNPIMKLASTVLFNKYISSVVLAKTKGVKNTIEALKGIYGGVSTMPKFDYQFNEMKLIPDVLVTSILEKIADAKSLVMGATQSIQVNDADGNALSRLSLSRLYGSLPALMEQIRRNPNSAAQHLSILKPGFYKGFYNVKDMKSSVGNKSHTQFTVSEFVQGNFLFDFVEGFIDEANVSQKRIIGNGIVGVLSSVNSDKGTIGDAVFDLNQKTSLGVRWRDLNHEQLVGLTSDELSRYYINLQNKVLQDFDLLQQLNPNIPIDYQNNFKQFNQYCSLNNISATDQLRKMTLAYNKQHPLHPIELVDLIYFSSVGNEVTTNNTLKSLINKYSDRSRYNRFIKLKELDILKALVDENISINLQETSDKYTPKQWLKDNYPEWVGKPGVNNGKMTLAKITINGKTYRITDRIDLVRLGELFNLDFSKNLHVLKDFDFLIHPMILKWNDFDGLLSQEFLLTSVGSHVNHSGKIKHKPVVVSVNSYSEIPQEFISFDQDINNSISNGTSTDKAFKRALELAARLNKILVTTYQIPGAIRYEDSLENLLDNGSLIALLDVIFDNEIREEAKRFLAQHKRNVALTALMYAFLPYQIDGTPAIYNVASIEDVKFNLYTVNGIIDSSKPHDGCTWVNPLVVYWENNALDGNRAGTDKKPFVHFYNYNTGTGGIIKTAGFGITNDLAKKDKFYRIMAYNMMHYPWRELNDNVHIMKGNGILEDFEGNVVNYAPIYYKKGTKYFYREIISYNGNNSYTIKDYQVDIEGNLLKELESDIIITNSNYDVWLMFGGWNSMELSKQGELIPSELSILSTVQASISYGLKLNDVVDTAEDVWQPMKHSDIHWLCNEGAIKLGISNTNSKNMFYKKGDLNHFRVPMNLAGIQLDKEHHADNSELSLMTLVMSAAASKGYTRVQALKLYDALYTLTKIGTRTFRDSLGNITTDPELFDAAASQVIVDAIIHSSSTDGDLIQIIAKDLITAMKENKTFALTKEYADLVDNYIPYSNKGVFKKFVSIMSSSLTKAGIRQKLSGILAVLKPTQEIIKFYKAPLLDSEGNIKYNDEGEIIWRKVTYGQLENYYDVLNTENEEDTLVAIQNLVKPIQKHQVEIGRHYELSRIGLDGKIYTEVVFVELPNSLKESDGTFNTTRDGALRYGYRDIKNDTSILEIREHVIEGNDLQSYNIRFSDGVNLYLLADLDILQDYFDLKKLESKKDIYKQGVKLLETYGKPELLKTYIQRDLKQHWEKRNENKSKELILELLSYLEDPENDIINLWDHIIDYDFTKKHPNLIYFKEYLQDYLLVSVLKLLNRELQLTLSGLSNSSSITKVRINQLLVAVDKSSIITQAYGCVMPKTFKSNLGLDDFDDVEVIKNDPDFFIKKLAERFTTRVNNYDKFTEEGEIIPVYNYHLELKKNNGNHLYVRAGLSNADLVNRIPIDKFVDEDGNIFRRDNKGNILYQLYSMKDEVYLDYEGNEIIVTQPDSTVWTNSEGKKITVLSSKDGKLSTSESKEVIFDGTNYIIEETGEIITKTEYSGLLFYLDNSEYNSFYINKANTDLEFDNILTRAASSTNQVASSLAKRILKLGSKEPNRKKAIKKQRELSDKMNDYVSLYLIYLNNKDSDNPNYEQGYFAFSHLAKIGRRMHTSFLKSLDIIAARIPAQNLQSFMAMLVEGYENVDINSAYVSSYQFYLLGSDLDIDAVSLQTFTLDKSGIFTGHSPYYNLDSVELLKASEQLPFPSGEPVQIVDGSTIELYVDEFVVTDNEDFEAEDKLLTDLTGVNIEEVIKDSIFKVHFKDNGEVKLIVNLDTPVKIKKFSEFLIKNSKQYGKVNTPTFIREFYDVTGKSITIQQAESLDKQLIDIIDKHNLYINKSSVSKRTGISRNYITLQAYDLIIDPINQQQAQSSVDGITGTAKNLAAQSPRAAVQDTFTPHNVINKLLSISENMVGKDGIAVCATGLKSFFALTQMWNLILNGDDVKAKQDLMFNVNIGGYNYRGLSNVFSEKVLTDEIKQLIDGTTLSEDEILQIEQLFTNNLIDYLVEQFYALDASNEKSAMLSLSTDNAKELVLNKINASTATLGMYIYGLSIGVPFKTLYNIINSKLGVRLNELTKGNLFNGDKGTIDIIGALDYMMQEPTNNIIKFDNFDLGNEKIPTPSQLLLEGSSLRNIIKSEIEGKQNQEAMIALRNIQNRLEQARNKFSTLIINDSDIAKQYEILYNQLIDFAIQYAEDVALVEANLFYSTIYGGGSLVKDFENLALGAVEMKAIGKILKLNLGIDTDSSELIEQVNRISYVLVKRLSQINRQKKRGKTPMNNTGLSDALWKEVNVMLENKQAYKIDFSRFIKDKDYANKYIRLYDLVKFSYNPLKILRDVKHFRGYAETLFIDYETCKRKSSKFKLLAEYKDVLENDWNIYDQSMKDQLSTNIENLVDTYYRLQWMKQRYSKKRPTMPMSTLDRPVSMFIDNASNPRPVLYSKDIQLGTILGDANFKLLMESVIIPEMLILYPNNKFIQALTYVVNPKTTFGTIASNYGLQINMMPKEEYDREVFREYKKAFNDLIKEDLYKDAAGVLWSPQELLYMYSLITNNGKISPSSLHGIFEDYLNSSVAKDFYKTISKYDNSEESYQELLEHIKRHSTDLLPYSTPYKGGSDKFRQFNKDTEEVIIWETNKLSDEEMSMMDPQELLSMIGNYTPSNFYASGFNTDFFLNGVRNSDLESVKELKDVVDITIYPELSKYSIKVQNTDNGVGIISISASTSEEKEKAKLFMEYILKNNNGILREKTVISKKDGALKFIDLSTFNDELANIKCLNV